MISDQFLDRRQVVERLTSSSSRDGFKAYLNTVKDLHMALTQQYNVLETELLYLKGHLPLQASDLAKLVQDCTVQLQESTSELQSVRLQVQDYQDDANNHAAELLRLVKRAQQLQMQLVYTTALKRIADIHDSLALCLHERSWNDICDYITDLKDICGALENTKCTYYLRFATTVLTNWLAILRSQAREALDLVLSDLEWPLPDSFEYKVQTPAVADSIAKLKALLRIILVVAEPGLAKESPFDSILPFMPGLMERLDKRFKYHFHGDKQTNAVDKPEWFYTQVITWIKAHASFLQKYIQPVVRAAGFVTMDVGTEFARHLVGLAATKLRACLQQATGDRENLSVFSHLVDETVIFEMELSNLGYPDTEPNCLEIFAEPDTLRTWMHIEHTCNTERAELLLTDERAWLNRYQSASDIDEMKVPAFADDFLVLLQLITERYKLLRSPAAKLQFLSLQQGLMDDFRVRLLQVARTQSVWDQKFSKSLNAAAYMISVLREWNDLPFFVRLQSARTNSAPARRVARRSGSSSSEATDPGRRSLPSVIHGAFDTVVELLEHIQKEMLHVLVHDTLLAELRSKLTDYKQQAWHALKQSAPTNISAGFFVFLLTLRERLSSLDTILSRTLFKTAGHLLMIQLNQYLCDDFILSVYFNEAGAQQLKYDADQAFYPLLSSYWPNAQAHFKEWTEGLLVLSLNTGSALLLRETLRQTVGSDSAVLGELGVFNLSVEQVLRILKQRVDLPNDTFGT